MFSFLAKLIGFLLGGMRATCDNNSKPAEPRTPIPEAPPLTPESATSSPTSSTSSMSPVNPKTGRRRKLASIQHELCNKRWIVIFLPSPDASRKIRKCFSYASVRIEVARNSAELFLSEVTKCLNTTPNLLASLYEDKGAERWIVWWVAPNLEVKQAVYNKASGVAEERAKEMWSIFKANLDAGREIVWPR